MQSPTKTFAALLLASISWTSALAAESQVVRDRIVTEAVMRVADPEAALAKPAVRECVNRYVSSMGSDPAQLVIIEKLKLTGIADHLIDVAMQLGDSSDGLKALELAMKDGGVSTIRQLALVSETDADLQRQNQAQRLTRILSLSNRGPASKLLQEIVNSGESSSSLRLIAATGLARNTEGQRFLIDLASNNKLSPDAATMVASTLRASSDTDIAQLAAKLFPASASSGTPLQPIDVLVKSRGNVEEGHKLFTSVATCSQCHIVNQVGKNVGPDLSEIGDKLTREAMYVAILNPSAGISHNYEAYTALTNDGAVITGLLVTKNDDELVLRDKEGIERKMAMDDIEEYKKLETSLMPANLQDLVQQQGLIDVVEYMTTLKKKQ